MSIQILGSWLAVPVSHSHPTNYFVYGALVARGMAFPLHSCIKNVVRKFTRIKRMEQSNTSGFFAEWEAGITRGVKYLVGRMSNMEFLDPTSLSSYSIWSIKYRLPDEVRFMKYFAHLTENGRIG